MKKVFATILSLGLMLSVLSVPAFAAGYEDTENHWGKEYIDRWTGYEIVSGYPDGTFRPNKTLTRAEAASVFANLLQLEETADVSMFVDVPANAWYKDAIAKCYAAGIMVGVSDNEMNPNATLTREQMMIMVCKALGIEQEATLDSDKNFADYGKTHSWAKGYVNALVNAGIVSGLSEDTLAPRKNINRASMMALLGESITVYANEDGQEVAVDGTGIVLVVASDVTIKDAPEGTVVVTAPEAAGTTINGVVVEKDTVTVVGTTGGNTTGGTTTGGTTTGGTTTGGTTTGGTTTGGTTTGGTTTGGTMTGGTTTGGTITGGTTTGGTTTGGTTTGGTTTGGTTTGGTTTGGTTTGGTTTGGTTTGGTTTGNTTTGNTTTGAGETD